MFTQLLLAAWLGAALLATTVVAPAAFAVLPTRTLAGTLVGRVLPALFWSGTLVGLLVAADGWRTRRLTRRDAPPARRAGGHALPLPGVLLAAACLVAQLAIGPRVAVLRASIPGPVGALAADDARRIAFGRLHALSVAALGAAMLAGGVALPLAGRAVAQENIPRPPEV